MKSKKPLTLAVLLGAASLAGNALASDTLPPSGQFSLSLNRFQEAPDSERSAMLLQGTGAAVATGFQGATASLIAVSPAGIPMAATPGQTPASLNVTYQYRFDGCSFNHPRIEVMWNSVSGTVKERRGTIVPPASGWQTFEYKTALNEDGQPATPPTGALSVARINLILEANLGCQVRMRELHVFQGGSELAYAYTTAGDPPDYGNGIMGGLAKFMGDLGAASLTLFKGNLVGAQDAIVAAVQYLLGAIYGVIGGTHDSLASTLTDFVAGPTDLDRLLDNLGGVLGLDTDPATAAQRAIDVARKVEPVIVSGAALAGWSVPAAVGIANPHLVGSRGISNGTLIYPASGQQARPGVPVNEIAAYRFEPGHPDADRQGFVEIPVQVDERMPYFLANPNSSFYIYSGTDPELNYVWDLERWNPGTTADGCNSVPQVGRPDPVPGIDNDDEIVFMAQDAGERAPPLIVPDNAKPQADGQEIVITDPLDPANVSYVYLFRKVGGSSFRNQAVYVNYTRDANADQWIDRTFFADNDPEKLGSSNTGYGANLSGTVCHPSLGKKNSTDRFPRDGVTVTTDAYRWYASGRWMVRDIRVKDPEYNGPLNENYWSTRRDLIDRWKGRAFQQSPDATISVVGFEDEQVNWEANSMLIGERKGPIRAIREVWGADSGTNVTKTETFYRDAITYRYRVRVHPIPPDGLYTDWDYNRNAMLPEPGEDVEPGRYYTALRPFGVPIDGINDDVGNIDSLGGSPAFFDVADPTFNLPLGFFNWEQVSGKGNLGSLVYIFEMTGATSLTNPTVVPYYRDDACLDDGTGDDPVQRPWPGERSTDARVIAGYSAANGGKPYAQLACHEKQGAHGQHGVHYFFTHDSDNAFSPLTSTEIDGMQWQFMVPTSTPQNIAEPYANVVKAPLKAVASPRPTQLAQGGGDADGDGVADDNDLCPNTPRNETANAQGCSASQRDTDGDGVNDAADLCENTPSGQSVNGNGCSASQRDSDGDGLNDAVDQCPFVAGLPVNNGCPDTTPNAFGFTAVSGVSRNTVVSSNVVTITGIDAPAPVSIDVGEYRINGGAWIGAPGGTSITNGQTVQVRHVSAATASTVTETTLTIGGVSGKFRSTTSAGADTDPDAFTFGTKSNVPQGEWVVSDAIIPTGYDAEAVVKAGSGTEYSLGCTQDNWTSMQGTISPGQSICVRHMSASTPNTLRRTSLQIGRTVGYFTTRTAP
jgi:hypothetical protein